MSQKKKRAKKKESRYPLAAYLAVDRARAKNSRAVEYRNHDVPTSGTSFVHSTGGAW